MGFLVAMFFYDLVFLADGVGLGENLDVNRLPEAVSHARGEVERERPLDVLSYGALAHEGRRVHGDGKGKDVQKAPVLIKGALIVLGLVSEGNGAFHKENGDGVGRGVFRFNACGACGGGGGGRDNYAEGYGFHDKGRQRGRRGYGNSKLIYF